VALAVAQSAASIPRAWDEAARSLGAGRWSRLATVWWPVVGPVWLASVSQVFILCSMSFVIVMVLGGGPPVETLETAIYSAVRMGTLDLPLAARLAAWQLALSLLPWLAVRALFRPVNLKSQKQVGSSRGTPVWAWLLALGWLLPYFCFFKDWHPSRMGESWDWGSLRTPIFFSVGVSVATAWFAVGWGILSVVALGRRVRPGFFEALLLLPSGVGTLTLSMGFWLAYSSWVDPFAGSVVALVLIQGVVFFPFALRTLLPVAQAHPRGLWELARSQGASPAQAFWAVEWPRWRQPVWSTIAMIASASRGEVAAVSFFSSEHLVTLPLLASRWMATYRFDQAYGVSALLLLLAVLVAFLPGLSRQSRNFFGA
jgi:ABC-type Fe3+ transport system permease subunit